MSTKLKLRGTARFLASIFAGVGTVVRKDGLATYIDLDYSQFGPLSVFSPTTENVLVQSTLDGSFGKVTLAQLVNFSQTQQVKTTAGDVNVAATDGVIAVNKMVGAVTAVNMPLSTVKVGGCLVDDFKGDAGTNNITINLTAPDVFPGGGSTWVIESNAGSVYLRPIPGVGYAI